MKTIKKFFNILFWLLFFMIVSGIITYIVEPTKTKMIVNELSNMFNDNIDSINVDSTLLLNKKDTVDIVKITKNEDVIPFRLDETNDMHITIDVNDIPMEVTFATGCSYDLTLSKTEYDFLKKQNKIGEFSGQSSSINANGETNQLLTFKIDSIKIGNHSFYDVTTAIGDEDHAMLIGQGIMKKFSQITIDYKNKNIKLIK